MNTVEFILVVMLSIGFLVLLILSIVVITLMITILRSVKRISDRAESATTNVASIAETISSKLAPIATSGIISMIVKQVMKKKK